jgi:hypothetical protein
MIKQISRFNVKFEVLWAIPVLAIREKLSFADPCGWKPDDETQKARFLKCEVYS